MAFAIKPAIKEHFFYATKSKAWRANNHSELATLFERASQLAGSGEIMVQELIPGWYAAVLVLCVFPWRRSNG
jgi:predicted ATP-grasp superfamily ATP-dependent carboligase